MQRQANLLSYEKGVNPTNNKLFQMLQVQHFGEVTENFSRKGKKNCGKGFEANPPKAFNSLRVNAYCRVLSHAIWQTTYLVLLLLLAV